MALEVVAGVPAQSLLILLDDDAAAIESSVVDVIEHRRYPLHVTAANVHDAFDVVVHDHIIQPFNELSVVGAKATGATTSTIPASYAVNLIPGSCAEIVFIVPVDTHKVPERHCFEFVRHADI